MVSASSNNSALSCRSGTRCWRLPLADFSPDIPLADLWLFGVNTVRFYCPPALNLQPISKHSPRASRILEDDLAKGVCHVFRGATVTKSLPRLSDVPLRSSSGCCRLSDG